MKKILILLFVIAFSTPLFAVEKKNTKPVKQQITTVRVSPNALILQTDFGIKDGAVAAMRGVAFGVNKGLHIFDLTHEIPPYNIWEAAYRLYQAAQYWPRGSVFVSVVDPGVGTPRKSVVVKTKSGHYFVSPDNGSLTLVADYLGIEAVRQIDERKNRLAGSEKSYTFHGRDIYAYTGARLASGVISFEEVGPLLPSTVERLEYQKASMDKNELKGNIPILDIQYGNVWTNIDHNLIEKAGIKKGNLVRVTISEKMSDGSSVVRFSDIIPYTSSFGEVPVGKPLLYLNSLLNVSLALNMSNFAETYDIGAGANWTISITLYNK